MIGEKNALIRAGPVFSLWWQGTLALVAQDTHTYVGRCQDVFVDATSLSTILYLISVNTDRDATKCTIDFAAPLTHVPLCSPLPACKACFFLNRSICCIRLAILLRCFFSPKQKKELCFLLREPIDQLPKANTPTFTHLIGILLTS